MINQLALIQVRQFDLDEKLSADLEKTVKAMSRSLEKLNWERIVKVREDGEYVDIFLNINEEAIHGLMVMVVESTEAVFVNIAGTLDTALLSRLGAQLDIPHIGDLPIMKKTAPKTDTQ